MSGGGDSPPPQPTETTVTNVTIPEWLKGPTLDVVGRGQALSLRPYQAYRGPRVAGFAPEQEQAFAGISKMQRPADYATARQAMQQNLQQFGQPQADYYMSPYQQAVTDVAQRKLDESAARERAMAAARSTRMGGMGASGSAVANAAISRNYMQQSADLWAQQQQKAYENAQAQFERDRMARMQGATGLASLGTTEQQSDLSRLQATSDVGRQRQAQQQRGYDLAYEDFLRQRDYPMEMLKFYADLVRGQTPELPSTKMTYQQEPGFWSQVVGGGLTGLAALKSLAG